MGFNLYGEVFSKVYDLFWDEFILEIGPQIVNFINNHNEKNDRIQILDLFCGTGRLAKILLNAGFLVIGLDKSKYMLKIAKSRNSKFLISGKAEFIEGSAESFVINKPIDTVIATFDSINHLPDQQSLLDCFNSVYSCLKEDGIFIFDLNTKRGLKSWNFIDIEDTDDTVLITHGKYEDKSSQAYTKVIGFHRVRENMYERFEEIMYNTLFSIELVKQTLYKIGWKTVYFAKEDNLKSIISTDPENELRVFIIAKK